MKRVAIFPAVILFFMVVAMRSAHAGPSLVNYQGVLRDAGGTPLSGNYDMTFRFFNAASGGEEILVDRHTAALLGAVTVSGGLFDVALGGGSVSDGSGSGSYGGLDAVFDNYQDVWLEVTIGTEALAPRTKIEAVPYAIDATNAESANASVNANNAWMLNNQAASYYVDTSSTRQIKTGALSLQSNYFGAAALDVISNGSSPMAVWAQNDDGTLCKLASSAHALECSISASQTYVGSFENTGSSARVWLASAGYGVEAEASYGPGWFHNLSGNIVLVARDTYKIQGNGAVSFVQNVPKDPAHVIVYAAPEGDEVAVYTRGSGRLVNGEAHVALGPTFAQVANPDVGLTATVTPRGTVPVPLSAASISTGTLVVRGPEGSDAAFDYTVWGLRIGFESQTIVQPKEFEAKIPSMTEHAARVAAEPWLREYTAVARFRKSEAEAFGRTATETPRADALLAAVGVFPGVVPVRPPKGEAAVSAAPKGTGPSVETVAVADGTAIAGRHDDDSGIVVLLIRQATDEGSVVSLDPDAPGYVRPSTEARDPLIIGCASASDNAAFGQLPVATSRIALCRVDATYGRIDVGDRLVASPTPGHAMRDDGSIKEATVLGRAIDRFESGAGLIRVLVAVR